MLTQTLIYLCLYFSIRCSVVVHIFQVTTIIIGPRMVQQHPVKSMVK